MSHFLRRRKESISINFEHGSADDPRASGSSGKLDGGCRSPVRSLAGRLESGAASPNRARSEYDSHENCSSSDKRRRQWFRSFAMYRRLQALASHAHAPGQPPAAPSTSTLPAAAARSNFGSGKLCRTALRVVLALGVLSLAFEAARSVLGMPTTFGFRVISDSGGRRKGHGEAAVVLEGKAADACEWGQGGPVAYALAMNTGHNYDADHWFHVAECFTARHKDLRRHFDSGGAAAKSRDVYLQIFSADWANQLTPMTRLLVAAGLTNGNAARRVHFLSPPTVLTIFSETKKKVEEKKNPPVSSEKSPRKSDRARRRVNAREDAGGGGNVVKNMSEKGNGNVVVVAESFGGDSGGGGGGGGKSGGIAEPRAGKLGQKSGKTALLAFGNSAEQDWVLSMDQPEAERLVKDAGLQQNQHANNEICVKFLGKVGAFGTRRDSWFPNQEDLLSLRRSISRICPSVTQWGGSERTASQQAHTGVIGAKHAGAANHSSIVALSTPADLANAAAARETSGGQQRQRLAAAGERQRQRLAAAGERQRRRQRRRHWRQGEPAEGVPRRRLVIYDRDRSRRISNAQAVADRLQLELAPAAFTAPDNDRSIGPNGVKDGGWIVEVVVHSNERHPCELAADMGAVDVLVTAHGFQSMMILFLRPGAALFELYPHRYYKAGYKPLAGPTGVRYAFGTSAPSSLLRRLLLWPFSTERCMSLYLCRSFARGGDVELSEEHVQQILALAAGIG